MPQWMVEKIEYIKIYPAELDMAELSFRLGDWAKAKALHEFAHQDKIVHNVMSGVDL